MLFHLCSYSSFFLNAQSYITVTFRIKRRCCKYEIEEVRDEEPVYVDQNDLMGEISQQ